MKRVMAVVLLGGVLNHASAARAQASPAASIKSEAGAGKLTDLPPLPDGKSTILGGQIRDVDPVRDRLVLHVYGMKPLGVLYDERTQVFRDGKEIPLRELGRAITRRWRRRWTARTCLP